LDEHVDLLHTVVPGQPYLGDFYIQAVRLATPHTLEMKVVMVVLGDGAVAGTQRILQSAGVV
jgi:hypothetical protein